MTERSTKQSVSLRLSIMSLKKQKRILTLTPPTPAAKPGTSHKDKKIRKRRMLQKRDGYGMSYGTIGDEEDNIDL